MPTGEIPQSHMLSETIVILENMKIGFSVDGRVVKLLKIQKNHLRENFNKIIFS